MVLKHIVISGGGPTSLITYGVLRELNKKDFWKLKNIESIYGCSAGSLLSLIIILDYNWDWIDDFFIKRPWDSLIDLKPETILNINYNVGIIDEDMMNIIISPLLEGKGLDKNITMKELYEYTKIKLNLYTCNIETELEKVCITHESFPDLPVYKAIYMSLTIPGICKPIYNKTGYYVDGGYMCHYPTSEILKDKMINKDEILSLFINSTPLENINEKTTFMTLVFQLFNRMQLKVNCGKNWGTEILKNEVKCSLLNNDGMVNWFNLMNDETLRKNHIEHGKKNAICFLKNLGD